MKISLEEVSRIARLAHLRLGQDEMARFRGHLEEILTYIDTLNELPTEDLEPAAGGALGAVMPLRADALQPTLSPDDALANAPESGQGHFKVPRVIG